jgi:hypothetical protein
MQVKITKSQSFTLAEILGDNGQPANGQNPINRSEYAAVDLPEANGQLLVVSGMPMSAAALVSLHYKNQFSAVAIANPREGVAEIVHSITADYAVGGAIPLA